MAKDNQSIDIEEVISAARELFTSDDAIDTWLKEPAPSLEGRKPIDLLTSAQGRAEVVYLIRGILYGNCLPGSPDDVEQATISSGFEEFRPNPPVPNCADLPKTIMHALSQCDGGVKDCLWSLWADFSYGKSKYDLDRWRPSPYPKYRAPWVPPPPSQDFLREFEEIEREQTKDSRKETTGHEKS